MLGFAPLGFRPIGALIGAGVVPPVIVINTPNGAGIWTPWASRARRIEPQTERLPEPVAKAVQERAKLADRTVDLAVAVAHARAKAAQDQLARLSDLAAKRRVIALAKREDEAKAVQARLFELDAIIEAETARIAAQDAEEQDIIHVASILIGAMYD